MDSGYQSHGEAWQSGYNACLHDMECYAWEYKPKRMPKWMWRKLVLWCYSRAKRYRGVDIS